MNKSGGARDLCLSSFGSLATIFSTSIAMGCCAGFFASLASLGAMALPFLHPSFHTEVLYSTVAVFLTGLTLSYRPRRSVQNFVTGLAGASLLVVPFHAALDLRLFYLLIGLGLSGMLFASWAPLVRSFYNGNA